MTPADFPRTDLWLRRLAIVAMVGIAVALVLLGISVQARPVQMDPAQTDSIESPTFTERN